MEPINALTRLLESVRGLKQSREGEPTADERQRRLAALTAMLEATYERRVT